MKNLRSKIEAYKPYNEQETHDKELMLNFIDTFGRKSLSRECVEGHFTASAFIFNKSRSKVLMCEHIIDKSLAWIGGHSDGMSDLLERVKLEINEETGIKKFDSNGKIACLTAIAVPGHVKKGAYVSSHLHLDVAYIFEADENEKLESQPDENTGVRWVTFDEMRQMVTDTWRLEVVYNKLIEQYA